MKSIYDTLKENGNFTTLLGAIDTAGMEPDFTSGHKFTLFAPLDDAFSKVPKNRADTLLKDRRSAEELVRCHTMKGRFLSNSLENNFTALNGESVKVDRSEGLKIGDALAVQLDIECDNGVIHVIDRVLIPRSTLIRA
jgi:uncharacterized surface protein with fasciclin (FAS1) repeats